MPADLVSRASIDIDAPADRVWAALVSPDAIRQYMFGTRVASDWTEGSPITWSGEWQGRPYQDHGRILRFEPPTALRYSHFSPLSGLPDVPENHHTVTVDLTAVGAGTTVTLTQDNNPDQEARRHSDDNWALMLQQLKRYVESGLAAGRSSSPGS